MTVLELTGVTRASTGWTSPSRTVGLIGESGSGRPTLGRLALRLLAPHAGSVRFDGEELTTPVPIDLHATRRRRAGTRPI